MKPGNEINWFKMKKRYRIYITGNVQRVGFRNQASDEAVKSGISGKAMYIDHAVVIEAEGGMDVLPGFISWCRKGPESCLIESVEVTEMPLEYDTDFSVVHGIVSSARLTDIFSLMH